MDVPSLELHTVAVLPVGCFSVVMWEDLPIAVALERTFEDGRPIIEKGIYDCVKSFFNKGGYGTYEIKVPGHDRILFHKGNTEVDSEGCVLVGESFGMLGKVPGILQSGVGFAEFMSVANGVDGFQLLVTGR